MSKRIHPKYENITSRWGGMRTRIEFDSRIESWICTFKKNEQELLLELLANFHYYGEDALKKKVQELHDKFGKENEFEKSEIVFTKIYKEHGVAFSDIYFCIYWSVNNLYSNTETNMIDLLSSGSIPKFIAIVDDYLGTGQTVITTINKFLQTNQNILDSTIFVLALHSTNRALQMISRYSDEIKVEIKVVSLDVSDETFKEGYLYSARDLKIKYSKYMKMYENKIGNRDQALGYEKTASLVAFNYNTPNNTLGLFWQAASGYIPLFPRKRKETTTLRKMQRRVEEQKKERSIPIIYGIEDRNLIPIIEYCLTSGKNFSYHELESNFGLTASQLNDVIRVMLGNGYITYEQDRYVATTKLRSQMFTNRLKTKQKLLASAETFDLHIDYIPTRF